MSSISWMPCAKALSRNAAAENDARHHARAIVARPRRPDVRPGTARPDEWLWPEERSRRRIRERPKYSKMVPRRAVAIGNINIDQQGNRANVRQNTTRQGNIPFDRAIAS